ncbi:hypothetical protein OPV22_027040 [Ensete ventricosum]|uniref:DUF641 domain-containing protein n=1 Tax=Ensete ventricosum TaxID=4639 RepID=A0AAV8Q2Q6_ENSVE|nr:hypothetical protein OPV22_027040 [Ensete ventricosum]
MKMKMVKTTSKVRSWGRFVIDEPRSWPVEWVALYLREQEEDMESPRVKPPPKLGTLARIFNKFFHLRCCVTCSANGAGMVSDEDDYSIHKLKLSQNFSDTSTILSKGIGDFYAIKHEKQQRKLSSKEKEVMESLLANLFSSDLAIVSELKRVSELRHSYFDKHFIIPNPTCSQSALAAQIEEQCNLMKAYQITMNKFEDDLKFKDSVFSLLQSELSQKRITELWSQSCILYPHSQPWMAYTLLA